MTYENIFEKTTSWPSQHYTDLCKEMAILYKVMKRPILLLPFQPHVQSRLLACDFKFKSGYTFGVLSGYLRL